MTFNVEAGASSKWIKFNANMTGLYRVQYEDDNWKALITQLKQDHTVSNLIIRVHICLHSFESLSILFTADHHHRKIL